MFIFYCQNFRSFYVIVGGKKRGSGRWAIVFIISQGSFAMEALFEGLPFEYIRITVLLRHTQGNSLWWIFNVLNLDFQFLADGNCVLLIIAFPGPPTVPDSHTLSVNSW